MGPLGTASPLAIPPAEASVGEAVGRCSDGVACCNLQAERAVLALSLRTISKIDLRQKMLNFI